MKARIFKNTGRVLTLVLSLTLILGALSVLGLGAQAATSTTPEDGRIGTAFPRSFAAEPSGDYYIETKAQLKYFQDASRKYTFANATIHLAADIDWGGSEGGSWSGIGRSAAVSFCGTFDGHGYTISNLYSKTSGLFYMIGSASAPATVKNFTLQSADISGGEGRAVVVSRFCGKASANTQILNVTVADSAASFSGNNCGIIAGRGQTGDDTITISGCSVTGTTMTCTAETAGGISRWGMILGRASDSGASQISECTVDGSSMVSAGCNLLQTGGIVGAVSGAMEISGCTVNDSTITLGLVTETPAQGIGGIVGLMQSGSASIKECAVTQTTITTKGLCQYVGLLAGNLYGGTLEDNTVSESTLDLQYNATAAQASRIGGLVGNVGKHAAAISGCQVSGLTVNNASRVNSLGGLIGNVESTAAGTSIADSSIADSSLYNTYATNTAYSFYLGGAIGRAQGKITANKVTVTNVTITSATLIDAMGGFAGYISGSQGSELTDCSVTGSSLGTAGYSDTAGLECYHVSCFAGCVDSASTLRSCCADSTSVMMQGRTYYMGGLIGSTYSEIIKTTPASGAVTVDHCAVTNCKLETSLNRSCARLGGLVGYLAEGSTVTNSYVSGLTGTKNTNSMHTGGLIGYIPNVSGDATTVESCYVRGAILNGKHSLGETVGNCVATNATLSSLWYYDCTLIRAADGTVYECPGALAGTEASFTGGETAWSLNTAGGTKSNSGVWTQGSNAPAFDTESTYATVRVTYKKSSGNAYRYTDASGNISDIPAADSGSQWSITDTFFTADTLVTQASTYTPFPEEFDSTPTGEYVIMNKEQLQYFQTASQDYDFAGVTVYLGADIDWGGSDGGDWGGIGTDGLAFCGTFDGNGHSINNLYSTTSGLFFAIGSAETPAVIKSFTLSGADISGDEGMALVVSQINGNAYNVEQNNQITDVHVISSTGTFTGNNCGVIAGRGQNDDDAVTVSGCTVTDTNLVCTTDSTTNVVNWGLIMGRDYSSGYSRFKNCTVTNSAITSTACNLSYTGGIVGLVTGKAQFDGCTVDGCSINTGLAADTVTEAMGGIVGRLQSSSGVITNCTVKNTTFNISGRCQHVGLLAGHLYGGTVEDNAVTDSTINTTYNASSTQAGKIAGLIGTVSHNPIKVYRCDTTGVTINNASRVNAIAGLIGSIESSSVGSNIKDCDVTDLKLYNTYYTNTGYSYFVAGSIGRSMSRVYVVNCKVTNAQITCASLVQGMGGFCGFITGSEPSVLTACSVSGSTLTQTQTTLNESYRCYHVSNFLGCVDTDSKLAGCSVTSTTVQIQGRGQYMGGLIGSTYSYKVLTESKEGAVTVKNCAVKECSLTTKNSRNCNQFGGLIGYLTEGSTVTNCLVSGMQGPANTNAIQVGGLVGNISGYDSSATTTIKNCYVENCKLNGKSEIADAIGSSAATNPVFKNIHYYNCTLSSNTGNVSGVSQVTDTATLTDGTLVTSLNTTAGTEGDTGSWTQDTSAPTLGTSRKGYTELKVMSYNIYWLAQNDTYPVANRQQKLINLLDQYYDAGIRVFGLQEVTGTWYSYITNFTNSMNPSLTYTGYGRYGGVYDGFYWGTNSTNDSFNLIIYDTNKYTLVKEGHFWLSDTPDVKSAFYTVAFNYRVANWVILRDKATQEEFLFLNFHLEADENQTNQWGYTVDGQAARLKQAQLVCEQAQKYAEGRPVVLVGDWNSYAGTDGYSTIVDNGYLDARVVGQDADQSGSYNAWTRTNASTFAKGDHIAVSPLCTVTVFDVLTDEDVDSVTGYHLSDHSPLIATIRY